MEVVEDASKDYGEEDPENKMSQESGVKIGEPQVVITDDGAYNHVDGDAAAGGEGRQENKSSSDTLIGGLMSNRGTTTVGATDGCPGNGPGGKSKNHLSSTSSGNGEADGTAVPCSPNLELSPPTSDVDMIDSGGGEPKTSPAGDSDTAPVENDSTIRMNPGEESSDCFDPDDGATAVQRKPSPSWSGGSQKLKREEGESSSRDEEEEEESSGDHDDSSAIGSASATRRKRRSKVLKSEMDTSDPAGATGTDSSDGGVAAADDGPGLASGEDRIGPDSPKKETTVYVSPNPQPNPQPNPVWVPLRTTYDREMGLHRSPLKFTNGACGSRAMVQRFALKHKLEHHRGCVNALHFNRSGTLLASGSDDLEIVLWDWLTNKPVLVYDSGHRSNVFQCKFMPCSVDTTVVSCARDGQVRVAELSSTGVSKGTRKLAMHRGPAHKLALDDKDPCVFLSCGEDAQVIEIDLRENKPNKLTVCKDKDRVSLYTIHMNPANSRLFAVGGRDHFVRVYDRRMIAEGDDSIVQKYWPDHVTESMKANITSCMYNYDGTELLASYNDEHIYLFGTVSGECSQFKHRYTGRRNNVTVKGVNFYGQRSEYVVSGSDCGHVFVWDKKTTNIMQFLKGDEAGAVNVLEPHPHLPVLATSGLDHEVKVWMPTSTEITQLEGLTKVMKMNLEQREEDIKNQQDMIDGHMLWFVMRQLGRAARRRAERGGNADEDSDSSDDTVDTQELHDTDTDDSDDSGTTDDEPPGSRIIQCPQS